MKKVLFVKNIIPPYRISLFNSLQKEICPEDNFEFEVFVFDRNEAGRSWYLREEDLHFRHIIDDGGFYRNIAGFNIRFNPLLFKTIRKQPETELILGSSWNDPNIITLVVLKRLGWIKNPISFWTEANYHTIHRTKKTDSIFKKKLRSFILNTCDQKFLIPGAIARETLFSHWGVTKRPVIYFPNLPANEYAIDAKILNEDSGITKAIIVARHDEPHKGILKFIKSIKDFENFKLFLAGEGPDTQIYRDYIHHNSLENNITFLGNISCASTLIKFYKKCDLFILPSIYDQSPLTIVEAASLGMPLFVSERCGNHPELVQEGVNGYTFNPDDAEQINLKLDLIKSFDQQHLKLMGLESQQRIIEYYDTKKVLRGLIDNI